MLKHRLILGIIFGLLFLGLIWLDWYASRGWPVADWSTPPGLVVLIVTLAAMPLAIAQMRALLARANVNISLRITILAAMLCTLWPWLEQVGDTIQQRHR